MKIYIVRHGETEENLGGILQGHLPGKLTQTGIDQANLLSERLKVEKFACVYSSDLARAKDTANIISKYHTCPVYHVIELRERDLGSFAGKKYEETKFKSIAHIHGDDVETPKKYVYSC